MVNIETKIGKLTFKNPVLTASGTFGYGEEFEPFLNLNNLGGFIVKGTTLEWKEGNAPPRMAETASGMLNAIGLQNKGVEYFINNIYPQIKDRDTNIIVNVSGSTIEEYVEVARRINLCDSIPAIELNISCPNVKSGGIAFGTDCTLARDVTAAVREVYDKTLIVKLSPNVTDITEFAATVEQVGADCISLINTLVSMAIDADSRKPLLSTVTGGLSGPAVKPIALRMVWQCYQKVNIPIIGIGGIAKPYDAIEFLLAGATAVQVGTANFLDPQISEKIVQGISDYLDKHNFSSVKEIIGALDVS